MMFCHVRGMYLSGVFFYFEIVTEVEVWGGGQGGGEGEGEGEGFPGGSSYSVVAAWLHQLKDLFQQEIGHF